MSVYLPADCATYRYDFRFKGKRYLGSTEQTTAAAARTWERTYRERLQREHAQAALGGVRGRRGYATGRSRRRSGAVGRARISVASASATMLSAIFSAWYVRSGGSPERSTTSIICCARVSASISGV